LAREQVVTMARFSKLSEIYLYLEIKTHHSELLLMSFPNLTSVMTQSYYEMLLPEPKKLFLKPPKTRSFSNYSNSLKNTNFSKQRNFSIHMNFLIYRNFSNYRNLSIHRNSSNYKNFLNYRNFLDYYSRGSDVCVIDGNP
jgi:hypothetical protein